MTKATAESLELNVPALLEFPKAGVVTAFLSGSQFDGFGHAESDIDLFIVSDERVASSQGYELTADFIDDQRVDIERWDLSEIEGFIEQLNRYISGPRGPHQRPNLTFKARVMLHRLAIGEAIYAPEAFADLRNRLNVSALAEVNYWVLYTTYINAQEDTIGLLTTGELDTALIACRVTLEAALDCLTVDHLDNNLNDKWRFRRLERNGLHDVAARYKSFLLGENAGDLRSFIEDTISFANDLLLTTKIGATNMQDN